jgi:hypothetical protein
MSIRQDIIKRIESDDPTILGELADLILAQRGAPKLKEVKFTTAELNKQIREDIKR